MPEISEQKREEIQNQAKKILENFAQALAKVNSKKKEFKKDVGGFREEGPGLQSGESFRKALFKNAPRTSKDFILAEKKKW